MEKVQNPQPMKDLIVSARAYALLLEILNKHDHEFRPTTEAAIWMKAIELGIKEK